MQYGVREDWLWLLLHRNIHSCHHVSLLALCQHICYIKTTLNLHSRYNNETSQHWYNTAKLSRTPCTPQGHVLFYSLSAHIWHRHSVTCLCLICADNLSFNHIFSCLGCFRYYNAPWPSAGDAQYCIVRSSLSHSSVPVTEISLHLVLKTRWGKDNVSFCLTPSQRVFESLLTLNYNSRNYKMHTIRFKCIIALC